MIQFTKQTQGWEVPIHLNLDFLIPDLQSTSARKRSEDKDAQATDQEADVEEVLNCLPKVIGIDHKLEEWQPLQSRAAQMLVQNVVNLEDACRCLFNISDKIALVQL